MIHSFDVFDTCLTRRMAVPSGVFHEVARKVFARLGISPTPALFHDFVSARIEAERIARKQSGREDITLADIWTVLLRSMGWPDDLSLMNCELETEAELLGPVAPMLERVQAARRAGHRIIFVSDMYLPGAFIEEQLKKHSFTAPGDGVYVSSEAGKTKHSGNLFRHVLEKEKVPAPDILHTGDNDHTDVQVPRGLGIQTRHFEPGRMTQTEIALVHTDGNPHHASRVAGAMRAFRLGPGVSDNEAIHELTSQFAGPFVMGLVVWVLQRAKENGVKRLYFCARDCQMMCKVAQELAPHFGDIECRYLYVSRQSLFLPSADAISPEGMPWLRRDWEEPVLRKLLAKLDLKYEQVESVLGGMAGADREHFKLKTEEHWTAFWRGLNQEPVRTQLTNLIATRRELTRQYFESAGLLEDVSWAIVDLGWMLTCQQALWKLLKQYHWPGKASGFYLGLINQRISRDEAGLCEGLFYQPPFDFPGGSKISTIFSRSTLLEHIVGGADHPSVHHHDRLADGSVGPAYTGKVSESAVHFCHQLQAEVVEFARRNPQLIEDFKEVTACRNMLASLVAGFFNSPSAGAARALTAVSATIEQNGFNAAPMVQALGWGKIFDLLTPWSGPGENWQHREGFWMEGSLAVTPPKIRQSLRLAQRVANTGARIRRKVWRR